jgi:hypothetical protein
MPLTNRDADFWWLRYFCGLALPMFFGGAGIFSIVSRHSYAVWAPRFSLKLVSVDGEQAILWGVVYLGMALALFANCYMQYHGKMGFYYEWPLALGAIAAGGGIMWYVWLALTHF